MNPKIPVSFPADSPYRSLASALDSLPNRFPSATNESHLRLLQKLYTPEEASLAAQLLPSLEPLQELASRTASELREITPLLKGMAQRGLIGMGKTDSGRLGVKLIPFVVGIYENQNGRLDAELAQLFEEYYQSGFAEMLRQTPSVHRVIPVQQTVKNNMEVLPYEGVEGLIERMQSYGVIPCICRQQTALVGKGCDHPIEVCMVLANIPDAFPEGSGIKPLTREGAYATLKLAAEAGLVHCVSNNQKDTWYICNCCICSCGILRGMKELGIANVVAKSAFVNTVDEDQCAACGECIRVCPFEAISIDRLASINAMRCVGCGVCVPLCPQGALGLVRRSDSPSIPVDETAWAAQRTTS